MLAQRIAQQSLRRLAAHPSTPFARTAISRLAAPGAIVSNKCIQTRPAATQPVSGSDYTQILIEQRKKRPVSPHLSIYRPQITWYLSMFHRITGSVLSGGLYIFATAYLVAPLFGWHLESQVLATSFAAWPLVAKIAAKYAVATPFMFHCWNGVRHLLWDTGKLLLNKQVVRTGWTVVGLTLASTTAVVFLV